MNPATAPDTSASRLLPFWARLTRRLLWLVVGLWCALLLVWGGLHGWIVPRIDGWRPQMEAWASRAVGSPVLIERVQARPSEGGWRLRLVPSFELQNVRLLDAQGQTGLQLPVVRVAVSLRSLWAGQPEQLVLYRPQLEVRRLADGRWRVAGLSPHNNPVAEEQATRWFFGLPEFAVEEGQLSWVDEQNQRPPLALQAVDLVLRNRPAQHQFRLDATPPPGWGQRFNLRGRLRNPADAPAAQAGTPIWSAWEGSLYADFPEVDVGQLQQQLGRKLSPQPQAGRGSLQSWVELKGGQLQSVVADLGLSGLRLQWPQRPVLEVEQLTGRVSATWDGDRLSLASEALRLSLRQGVHTVALPAGSWRWAQRHNLQGELLEVQAEAQEIDLGALAQLSAGLPLPKALQAPLAALRPEGVLRNWRGHWQAKASTGDEPSEGAAAVAKGAPRFESQGRLEGLGFAAALPATRPDVPVRPGLRGGQLDFKFDQDGGELTLVVAQGSLELPGVFAEPVLPLQRLQGRARWQHQGPGLKVQVDRLSLANADLAASAEFEWQTGPSPSDPGQNPLPGQLKLSGELQRGNAAQLHRYLPLGIGPEVRRYVQTAVQGGLIENARFSLQGAISDFPYWLPQHPGQFQIEAPFRQVALNYLPSHLQWEDERPWPALVEVQGRLLLEQNRLRFEDLQGRWPGAPALLLHQAELELAPLLGQTELRLNLQAQGPGQGMLDFVQQSPVSGLLLGALDQGQTDANAQLSLALQLPLDGPDQARVQGRLRLAGKRLDLGGGAPVLRQVQGALAFSEQHFWVEQAQAELFGGPVRFQGGWSPDPAQAPRLAFSGEGVASMAGLRQAGLGPVSDGLAHASGQTPYRARLWFEDGQPNWRAESDLRGVALALPAPLGKPAAQALAFEVEQRSTPAPEGQASADRLWVLAGPPSAPLLGLELERTLSGQGLPRVQRGRLALGLPKAQWAAMPASGVRAELHLSTLDLDAWRTFNPTAPAQLPGHGIDPVWQSYLPQQVSLRLGQLHWAGRDYPALAVQAERDGPRWRAQVDSPMLGGEIDYLPTQGNQAGSLWARLSHLHLAPSAPARLEQALQAPNAVPALDLAVADLRLGERALGRLRVQAQNRSTATGREWRLNELRLSLPEAELTASGRWSIAPQPGQTLGRTTNLDVDLQIKDGGALLGRFGQPGAVRGAEGRVAGQVSWLGSPLALDHTSLSGAMAVNIERGQFLRIEPGAAKLLGVLSLQALPRRLVLDFRDVFSEGFSFDFVRGDVRIEAGRAHTSNLQMDGINASVLLQGSADLARETQDLRVLVVPEVTAGTASLLASVVNPAVGLGTFVAQYLLRRPLQSAATREFAISGPWADPQVKPVERPTGAATATPAPASKPSAATEPTQPLPASGPSPRSTP